MARLKFFIILFLVIFPFIIINSYAFESSNNPIEFDIVKIKKLTGEIGQWDQNKKIYKIIVPHNDLKVLVGSMPITQDRGLLSTIDFKKKDNQIVLNGSLILLQDQVNPVMSVALTNGLQVISLNNLYLWDSPRVMVMRVKGEGNILQIAGAIGEVLNKMKNTANGAGDFPFGDFDFPDTTLNTNKIDSILEVKGQFKENTYQVQFSNGIKKTDEETNKIIAANTWAVFAGSDSEAVVNGSMMIHQSELQKALITLRKAQIYIFAIYQYSTDDDQDLVSINFWGIGNIPILAKALRSTFLIAQSKIKDIEAPIQLSLFQNNYCSVVSKAREEKIDLFSNSTAMVNCFVDAVPESLCGFRVLPVLRSASPRTLLTAASLERSLISQTLSKPKNVVSRSSLFSAKVILSKLSVVKDSRWAMTLSPRLKNKVKITEIKTPSIISTFHPKNVLDRSSIFSAKSILSKLSVIKNNRGAMVLSPRLKNKVKIAEIKTPLIIPTFHPKNVLDRSSIFSAKAILSRLSVVKDHEL